ncbi:glycosyltransferase [Acuticoccus sp.]|uniref:glycosyltransferase n=1 Tax=Acuticoccus sp. TaxID=1904378 RepID=UPI003B5262FE
MARTSSISVVIPHLNQEDDLRRCLAALHAQRGEVDLADLIVVDNGSTRLPEAVCAEVPGVTLLAEPAPGPGLARNLGVAHATGTILAFIDADCIPGGGWLAAVARAFEDPDTQVVGGDVRIATSAAVSRQVAAYEQVFAYRMDKYIAKQGFTGTGNLAVRREVFDRVGPFCGIGRAEDRDWGRRATALGHAIRYRADMVVFHPPRPTFAELARKWDRQIHHDYADVVARRSGRLAWSARAAAVAASPLVSAGEVALTPRLASPLDRVRAIACLVRIRLYRARRMLGMLGSVDLSLAPRWNREAGRS